MRPSCSPRSPSPGWPIRPSWSRPRARCSPDYMQLIASTAQRAMGGDGAARGGAGARRQSLHRSGVEHAIPTSTSGSRPISSPRAGCEDLLDKTDGPRRAHAPARQLLPEADRERALALQLPAHQSRWCCARRSPRAAENLVQGMANLVHDLERSGRSAQHQPDRRRGLRGRPQRGDRAGQGGLPERRDAAHPVRADHREGVRAAAADRAALDQQVLHPRSRAAEIVHPLRRVEGLHGVRGELGQPGRAPRAQDLRGLHDARASWPPPTRSSARPGPTRST